MFSDQTLTLPSVSGDALFFRRSHLVSFTSPPAGGARGGDYNFKVTKVRKTGQVVESSQIFIQNS